MACVLAVVAAAAAVLPASAVTVGGLRKAKADPMSITARAVNQTDIKFDDVEATLHKDQKLTVNEFATFCTANGVPWFMCKKVFEDADTNNDLVVIADEWAKLKPSQKDDIRAGFQSLNFNGDKSVSKGEWDAYCTAWMKPKPTKAQCDDLFKNADKNKNGMLDKVEFGSSSAGSTSSTSAAIKGGDAGEIVDKDIAYNKCWWVFVVLLISCCCISPASHFFHTKGKSADGKAMNIAGQVLGVVGCLVPFVSVCYLLWWTNIGSAYWSGGFAAVGTLCGILVVWATVHVCLAICQLGFVCVMGGAMAVAGSGGKM